MPNSIVDSIDTILRASSDIQLRVRYDSKTAPTKIYVAVKLANSDGEVITLERSATPDSTATAFLNVSNAITTYRQIDEAVRTERAKLKAALEHRVNAVTT